MKSGTHILQELMVALGYGMTGSGVKLSPEILPVFSKEDRWDIARLVYNGATLARACGSETSGTIWEEPASRHSAPLA